MRRVKSQLRTLAQVGVLCLAGLPFCFAQSPAATSPPADPHAPIGYTGAVVSVADDSVSLKDKDGKLIVVAMNPGWTVVSPHTLDMSAVKPGSFIASANENVNSDSGKSTELRIMEPGYKPEFGTHPMGKPNTSMTHGTVTKVDRSAAGVEVDVVYPGGGRHLTVPADVKVTGYDVHGRDAAKAGVNVTAVTRKGADGVSRAARLILAE
jgi:hypothetical protein